MIDARPEAGIPGDDRMVNVIEFAGGQAGPWRVTRIDTPVGDGLPGAARLSVGLGGDEVANEASPSPGTTWRLRGAISNLRYATRDEVVRLRTAQPPLDRPDATCAALIPIKKSARWWELAQDERRAIFEESSQHTKIGLGYLPAVARRLHHSRDLGEPFDFLTWFEFAPEHEVAFEALVAALRATPEWAFVEREVDIRLTRDAAG